MGVLNTLGYLVVQVRRSADETARASRESASTSIGEAMLRIAGGESAYPLFRTGMLKRVSLQDEERFGFHMIL